MNFLSNPLVARALWALPLLLLLIAGHLLWDGQAQRRAAERGVRVEAEVLGVLTRERSEITRGELQLRYTPPGATAPVERSLEMPLTFLKNIEARGLETVTLRVEPGDSQVFVEELGRPQWLLTFMNAAMAFIGALGIGVLVFYWNRLLAREGDPADRAVGTA